MKNKLTASLAAASLAAAFAVSLVAAPADSDRQGPPRGPDAAQHGGEGHQGHGHRAMKRGGESGDRLDRLIAHLDLTEDQVKAIRNERDDRADDARKLRDEIVDAQRKLRILGKEMRDAIAAHLTDEQKAKLATVSKGKRQHGEHRAHRGGDKRPDRSERKRGGDDTRPAKDR